MIARYTRPEMQKIWAEGARYAEWLRVELAVCEELAKRRAIPRKDWLELKKKCDALLKRGGLDPARVEFHEAVTRHDVIAFTTALAEKVGPVARHVHFGLTSSDVVDSALSMQACRAADLLLAGIDSLIRELLKLARAHRKTATIGRSHGIFAEPTSFGLKFLGQAVEWTRNRERLERAREGLRYGKLSGAVGVNAHWDPAFESRVLKSLGLKREPVSTQVVPRDRHAEFMNAIAICGGSLERLAVELRHLQRSEVGEVLEGFGQGQKGSSAMPHKRNPISSENLTGAARLLRSYAQAALENIALWHERDISHSSVERVIFPDSTILLDYALHRMTRVLKGLEVRKARIEANLNAAGPTVFSGHLLLALVEKGATREEAYAWVQRCALAHLEGKKEFMRAIESDADIRKHLSPAEIRRRVSLKHQLRHVDAIFSAAMRESGLR